ncbi:uncharacterized protein BDR25DRAFT_341024 [Lindgomyces ingoldianus]|uniref:Uncharacterized protein n=1 Tax=Lindgomyces ingoldianus TaxID=673940 RepID=A0ACB6R3A4_9PLEO|nr:uncharacterized protein BDR25DRAFT_341024 [Lindgomyces ingoldianus]KAF2473739.1 hypothetical protein BDR25DRAFT_341024 [Lindgomyces ingoldianus]
MDDSEGRSFERRVLRTVALYQAIVAILIMWIGPKTFYSVFFADSSLKRSGSGCFLDYSNYFPRPHTTRSISHQNFDVTIRGQQDRPRVCPLGLAVDRYAYVAGRERISENPMAACATCNGLGTTGWKVWGEEEPRFIERDIEDGEREGTPLLAQSD